jgi:hypothetical protein
MPDTLDASRYDLPTGALVDAPAMDGATGAGLTLIARSRARQEKKRKELEEWNDRFERLYDEAVGRNFDPPLLVQWADRLAEKERAAKEQLYPLIALLHQKIAENGDSIDPAARELIQESVDAANAWVTPYQTLRVKLLKLAAARRGETRAILRARPVEGDIDYAKLSREHLARYPKIRAALAK